MGTKRPLTDQEDTSTPHKLIKSNPKQSNPQQSDCSDCPICLESCHDPNQCFALDCCNRSLAKDSVPQMIHKTCFFASCRHALESAVLKGEKPITMTDERLHELLKCPRCRTALPFKRKVTVKNCGFHATISWLDGTCLASFAVNVDYCHGTLKNERALFFRTIVGVVDDLKEALKSDSLQSCVFYEVKQMFGEPQKISGALNPSQKWGDDQPILGFFYPPRFYTQNTDCET